MKSAVVNNYLVHVSTCKLIVNSLLSIGNDVLKLINLPVYFTIFYITFAIKSVPQVLVGKL